MKVLIILTDKGWQSDVRNALISAVEVDMSCNSRIFYCSQDFSISVKDLDLIEIGIQSRGYEDLVKHSNFLINVGFIGKLTNNSIARYKWDIKGIVSTISSKGIKMIKPMAIDTYKFNGSNWNLSKSLRKKIVIPETSLIYKGKNNINSIRFYNYKEIPTENEDFSLETDFENIDD